MAVKERWDRVIEGKRSLWDVDLKGVVRYKDLLWLFVRRDFVANYKQTVLGPLWFFIQPLLMTITFTVIFGKVAKISTDGIPQPLFYLSGITIWNYFASCLRATSQTFVANKAIFGKVYFPRLITPLSVVITNLMKFGVQFLLFLLIFGIYLWKGADIQPTKWLWFFPVLIVFLASLGMGIGMIVTAMTTKYRDLTFLIGFGIQLAMYATPVVYPVSIVPNENMFLILLNPMASFVEVFKKGFLGEGFVDPIWLLYSCVFSVLILVLGVIVFNKVERNFIDTV